MVEPKDHIIQGWELANPDPERFDVKVVDILGECRQCRHQDQCQFPAESIRRLVPKRGRLVCLDCRQDESGDLLSYYALLADQDTRFIKLKRSQHCWATASYTSFDELPSTVAEQWAERKPDDYASCPFDAPRRLVS